MISPDREALVSALKDSKLKEQQIEILTLLDEKYENPKHGHFKDWRNTYESLPVLNSTETDFHQDTIIIGNPDDIALNEIDSFEKKLKELSPWRKGPFTVFGIHIDTEWRSDWKWSRIASKLDLKDKLVLDIGCGNGYYALRMQAMGAELVLGIDPSWHYVFQFHALQKYSTVPQQAFVLPFAFEELPENSPSFDTIFSMGVLYHRQEPQQHLNQVYSKLQQGGQFILETLIINDPDADVLIPNDRYANMRNVWALPSIDVLKVWLSEAGFVDINVVDTTMTTVEEQRQTEWMTRYSLEQALNPDDHSLTVEGYQAPLRTTIIAEKGA
ncbi:MAG: tRNA 5-methoxyuridine(34)/uridine 5-oxyacetic acid(34) synthase CmoB [Gammaproteobacteria bacterium]|nr:MAG: tRNA 5-methoxyuridine(34)/uridine 5-oxyacetic acid(34) synthase CmoB [Gammaproteobacteria bacterium]